MTDQAPLLDTIETRKEIGFPGPKAWVMAREILKDGKLQIAGHPVMEDWEHPYMKALAETATALEGETLEVGYGLGISASYVLENPKVTSHTVIECHPDVVSRAMQEQREQIGENRFHILQGFWQDVVPKLKPESYQGILFDSYPLKEEEIHQNHFSFFEHAYGLLKPGGVLTYYSDEEVGLSPAHLKQLTDAGFRPEDIDYGICEVNTPPECQYWQASSFLVPVIRKPDYSELLLEPAKYDGPPLMRVAINSDYELTEMRPGDRQQLPDINLPHAATEGEVTLILRKRGEDKQPVGIVRFADINAQGEAALQYDLAAGQSEEIAIPALASAMKYAMQHFKIKSLHANIKGGQESVLKEFGFAESTTSLQVDEATLRQNLKRLGFPKAYAAEVKPVMPAQPSWAATSIRRNQFQLTA